MGLFETFGVPVNPMDMRALSEAEIRQHQIYGLGLMQNCGMQRSIREINLSRQLPGVPELPLDERFASFKVRLAVALERHGLTSST